MISRRNDSGKDAASERMYMSSYVDKASQGNGDLSHLSALVSHQDSANGNAQPLSEEKVASANGVILVIDDEEVVRSVTQRILERFGFDVLLASNGMVGLELFHLYAPVISCVLLDLSMPRLTGEDLYHELYRLKPDTRIILMSGYTEEDLLNRFSGMHPPEFLVKPFTAHDLHAKVRQVMNA